MSEAALQTTTLALQRLLHSAVARDAAGNLQGIPNAWIHVGPPQEAQQGGNQPDPLRPVSLFLFHVEPNKELRNEPRYTPPADPGSLEEPVARDAIALDLRYLVSVNRIGAAEPNELLRLGQVLAGMQATPVLGGALLPGQEVRLTLESYPMEELSRIWGLFPNQSYRTSLVYLAAPVFVDARSVTRGAPVVSRRLDSGTAQEPPDIFGRRREVEA